MIRPEHSWWWLKGTQNQWCRGGEGGGCPRRHFLEVRHFLLGWHFGFQIPHDVRKVLSFQGKWKKEMSFQRLKEKEMSFQRPKFQKIWLGHAPDPPRLTCLTAATYTPPGGGRHFKNLPLVELLLVTPFPKTSIEMLKSFFSMGFFVGGPRRGEIAKRSWFTEIHSSNSNQTVCANTRHGHGQNRSNWRNECGCMRGWPTQPSPRWPTLSAYQSDWQR